MPITYTEHPDTKTVEITIDGFLSRADHDAILPALQAFIDAHGTIRVIEVVKSFGGFDPTVLLPGIAFDLRNMARISHVAVVSDLGWVSPFLFAASSMTPVRLRGFSLDQIDAARAWIADPDRHAEDGPV